jgi:methanogenic corrinoid protein MtbC1
VARALDLGYRPREAVPAPLDRLKRIDAETAPPLRRRATRAATKVASPAIDAIVSALGGHDVPAVERMLRQQAAALGAPHFVVDVAAPLVRRVGELWESGKLAVRHEHLFSEVLIAQLHALRSAYQPRPGAPRILLTTLPGELHGLGLEMVALYLAAQGLEARVLGVSTPPDQIVGAVRGLNVDALGLSISASSEAGGVRRSIDEILPELPRRVPLWLGGEGAAGLRARGAGVRFLPDWPALDAAVHELGAAKGG